MYRGIFACFLAVTSALNVGEGFEYEIEGMLEVYIKLLRFKHAKSPRS